jgi:LPS export ABC transporter permease LptF/LPS export ABC transporter permease LptG
MRTIDRYVIREIVPPFLIALLVFTFILIIPFIIDLAEQMITKGVPWTTLLRLTLTLFPGVLGLTIPMSVLVSILVAFGRLSADREVVVLMACGVSPYRLLRPVLIFAIVCWGITSWLLLKAMHDANQAFREISFAIVMDRAEGEVRPRVFFEDFPGFVLYVREVPLDGGGWKDIVAADTSNPSQPVIYLARRGRMDVNRTAKTIQMVLEDGTRHKTQVDDAAGYEVLRFDRTVVSLDPERVFPKQGPTRGDRELSIPELKARAVELSAQGLSPHNQIMEIHKKFSIPVACFVFGILGLALGASHRRDGRLASFVVGIAIIFIYYVIMFGAQSMTKGHMIPAWSAMWAPDIILGAVGVWLLWSRARSADQPFRFPLLGWRSNRPVASDSSNPPSDGPRAPARSSASTAAFKLPSVTALRPNLLDIYVAKRYLQVLAMTTVGMLGLFYISTFIDLSDKWFKGQTTLAMLLELLWWSTPQFLSYVIALAVLLSALVTIGLLTKNSELIVMRACGISLYRTAVPLVVFGALASALLFGMEESVLATANQRAGRLNHVIRGGSPQTFDVLNRKWVVGHNGEVYHYQFYDPRRRELNGLSVFEFDPEARAIARRVYATKATWQPAPAGGTSQWRLEQGWSRTFGSTSEITAFDRFETTMVALEAPEYFVTEAPEPERMTFGQLRGYIDELRASGYNVLDHEVGLYRKVAFPFVTLVMTLIAVPFAVSTGRRGAMYGVGVGIVLALVYWTMISIFAAFGAGGVMSPMLAAWAPNLLFGATAAVLVLTVRT